MAMRIDSGFDLLSQGNRRADAVGQAVTALLGNVMARREAGRERQHETSMLEKEYGYKAANREAELTQLNKNALNLAAERGKWTVKAKGTGTPSDPNLSDLYGEQAIDIIKDREWWESDTPIEEVRSFLGMGEGEYPDFWSIGSTKYQPTRREWGAFKETFTGSLMEAMMQREFNKDTLKDFIKNYKPPATPGEDSWRSWYSPTPTIDVGP